MQYRQMQPSRAQTHSKTSAFDAYLYIHTMNKAKNSRRVSIGVNSNNGTLAGAQMAFISVETRHLQNKLKAEKRKLR